MTPHNDLQPDDASSVECHVGGTLILVVIVAAIVALALHGEPAKGADFQVTNPPQAAQWVNSRGGQATAYQNGLVVADYRHATLAPLDYWLVERGGRIQVMHPTHYRAWKRAIARGK